MNRLLFLLLLLPFTLHAQLPNITREQFTLPGPQISVNPTSMTLTGNIAGTQGASSPAVVSYSAGVGANITTNASTGIVQSLNNSTWTSTVTASTSAGSGSVTVYYALSSSAAVGTHGGTITYTFGATGTNMAITGTTAPLVSLSATPSSISGLNGVTGIAGTPQTETVTFSGTMITATPPAGTEVSKDGGSTYSSTQSFSTGSPLGLKIRTAAADGVGGISGNLVLSGSGVSTINVPVTGTVTAAGKDSMRVQMLITTSAKVAGWSYCQGDPSLGPVSVVGGNNGTITFTTLNPSQWGPLPPCGGCTPACIFPGDGLSPTTTFNYAQAILLEDFFTANTYDTTKHMMQFSGLKPSASYKIQLGGILQYNQFALGYYNVAGSAWQTLQGINNNGVANPNPAQVVWTLNSSSTGIITISFGTQGPGNVAVALGAAVITEQ